MTRLEEVKAKIHELEGLKQKDIDTVRTNLSDAEDSIKSANEAISTATESMNLAAFNKAKAELHKAETMVEMYSGRLAQIRQQEYIDEAESDEIIDSLLEYEKELEKDLISAIAEPIQQLQDILNDYTSEVHETEKTLAYWTRNIRKTYINRIGRPHRCEKPQQIHIIKYTGGPVAARLEQFLKAWPVEEES